MSCDLDISGQGHPKSIVFQILALYPTMSSLKAIGETAPKLSPTQEFCTRSFTDCVKGYHDNHSPPLLHSQYIPITLHSIWWWIYLQVV